jgi:hypothetical protein
VSIKTSKEDRSSKKACTKHCELCKQHGGAHTTHNTGDCRKYEKNGTKKKGFKKRKKSGSKNQNFAQVMKYGFVEIKKDLIKDIKSASRKKKRREYDSNSS